MNKVAKQLSIDIDININMFADDVPDQAEVYRSIMNVYKESIDLSGHDVHFMYIKAYGWNETCPCQKWCKVFRAATKRDRHEIQDYT